MVLLDILQESRKKYAEHPALIMRVGYRTVTLTFAQVYELAQRTAAFLEAHGVGKGDCVAVCAPNSPYWACLFWGCLLRGVVIVPLNIQSTDAMIAKIIEQTGAKFLFTTRGMALGGSPRGNALEVLLKQAVPSCTSLELALLDEIIAPYAGKNIEPIKTLSDDLIEILYTSGTTGEPKGVMLTHRNLMTNLHAIQQCLMLKEQHERVLSILPLSHILEQMVGFLLPFSCGATIVYAHSHGAIAQLLAEFKITKMVAVPEFLKVLMARIMTKVNDAGWQATVNRLMKFSLHMPWWIRRLVFRPILKPLGGCLNMVASGGAPLDPEIEQQWNALGVQVLQGYGLTETSPVLTNNTFADHRPGSVGRVAAGVSIRLVGGEIQAKGDSVFSGYFKNEQKTREVFTDDGWFMTGDMGQLDADGFLFIKGRRKYMIKGAGAQNVYPEDIEEFLNRESMIKDSCVVGLEQTGGAVQIHAVLLLKEALSNAEIEALVNRVNDQLATYQHIGGWSVWPDEDFPRSATRKIKKEEVITFLKAGTDHGSFSHGGHAAGRLEILLSTMTGVPAENIEPTSLLVRQLHMDSLMTVELLARIEDAFAISVDGWIIGPTTTVADIEEWISHGAPVQKPVRLKAWPRSWWARILRAIGQPIVVGIVRLFARVRVEGLENLEKIVPRGFAKGERLGDMPVIFMPNHVSMIDPFFLMAALPAKIRRRIAFASAVDVLYKDFWYIVPLTELLAYTFPFPRKETENVVQGLTLMGQVLDHGYSAVVFPEGQVSRDGQLQPLKAGAGLVASQMMVTVIPVALIGVPAIVGPDSLFPSHRGTVAVLFGKPIKMSRMTSIAQATAEIEKAMRMTQEKKRDF